MYILDPKTKRLIKAEKCTFKSLNLKERQDLQEWIADKPESLGEPLLIIQKEFDGFADTRERLDLLALDKNGNLVIIENKLDDSGKDVTLQAIKYASYCSTLNQQQIVDIFQKYLYSIGNQSPAHEILSDFFDGKDIEDVGLNKSNNSQRIILVAANFQKEVTSSVLWLQNFNLRIKCVKVTPYKIGNQVVINFDQFMPDAEDYQIKMADKERANLAASEATKKRHDNRLQFWSEFINYNKQKCLLFSFSSAVTDNKIGKRMETIAGGSINVCINKDSCRVELYIDAGDQLKSKEIFDKLEGYKAEIDAKLPGLVWQRMDDKVICRVYIDSQLSYLDENDKQHIYKFFVSKGQEMWDIFTDYGTKLNLK